MGGQGQPQAPQSRVRVFWATSQPHSSPLQGRAVGLFKNHLGTNNTKTKSQVCGCYSDLLSVNPWAWGLRMYVFLKVSSKSSSFNMWGGKLVRNRCGISSRQRRSERSQEPPTAQLRGSREDRLSAPTGAGCVICSRWPPSMLPAPRATVTRPKATCLVCRVGRTFQRLRRNWGRWLPAGWGRRGVYGRQEWTETCLPYCTC